MTDRGEQKKKMKGGLGAVMLVMTVVVAVTSVAFSLVVIEMVPFVF